MKPFALTVCTVLALRVCAPAAQDADRIGGFPAVDLVGSGADHTMQDRLAAAARLRPILIVKQPVAVLLARPGATYAIVAGLRQPPSDADRVAMIRPVLTLGCGRVGADGKVDIALPDADYAQLQAIDVLLQAAVFADGDTIQVSEPVSLRRRPDGDSDGERRLELKNHLPASFAVSATLSSTDSIPPFYAVHLTVVAPTTGYRLRHVATVLEAGRTAVTFELIDADPNMLHLTVLETLRASANLGAGGSGPIAVIVRRAAPPADKVEVRKTID